MIVTAKNRISFLWQLGIAAPWGVLRFKYMVIGGVFIFSLKKFIENPAGITFIMSIPFILSLAVNPICSFMSDRIWTRWGRRKPFVVPSMLGVVLAFILMPLMPNMWGLLAAFFLYQVSHDFGLGATDTIKQEVVPPKQRGTAAAIGTWLQNIANITFYLVALGRFDDYKFYAGFPITGEQSIYWGIAAAILMMALLMMLGVKETDQQSRLRGEKFTLRNLLGGLLNNQLWPVYLLITGWSVANAGLGALGALLYTEQWGFSKQEMGINIAVGSTLNIFIIILIGLFADKLPRMKTFKLLLLISIFIELAFYLYVEFVLFDKTPSLPEVIFFGEMASVAGIILGMLYMPLVYDYIPRNEMGTFSAGSVLVGKIVQVITLNGVGIFVTLYSSVFMPPGGDMARITLDHRTTPAEVRGALAAMDPTFADSDALSIETWFATNAAFDSGHSFEIRRRNADSLDLQKEVEKQNDRLKAILAKKSNAEANAERATIAGDEAAVRAALDEAATYAFEAAPIEAKIESLRLQQEEEAKVFVARVRGALGDQLVEPGDEVLNAGTGQATLFEYPLLDRPDTKALGNTLNRLRALEPELIDLVPGYRNEQFYLEATLRGVHTDPAFASRFSEKLAAVARPRLGEALGEIPTAPEGRVVDTVTLELRTIEDPINNYISPITKVIYGAWGWVGDPPPPERRLWATARALRTPDHTPHVGAWDVSRPDTHAIRIEAVLAPEAVETATTTVLESLEETSSAARQRLAAILGTGAAPLAALVDLHQRVEKAASPNKLTLPAPVLADGFAKPKYNYMSGYLWMVTMSAIGLLICLLFTRREEKGLIRKRGREESEAEAKAEEAAHAAEATMPEAERRAITYYRPGYIPHKIGMALFGLAMVGLGLIQLAPNLMLVLTGTPTTAVATQVVKERIGGSELILRSDAEIEAQTERYDRSYVFWNEFEFRDANGVRHEIRPTTGQQLRPTHPLLDADGLPTAIRIFYDPNDPQRFVVPYSFSTWFLSGLLVLFGSIGFAFGCILLYYANKPIEMPIVMPKDAPVSTD